MADFNDSPIEWENESSIEEIEKWIVKENIVFLIDASTQMFNKTKNDRSFFSICVEVCKIIVLKLMQKRNDKFCVIIYGTNDDNQTCPVKYIRVVSEPKKPNIELIKTLNELMSVDQLKYGQSPYTPLSDALWYASYLLLKSNEKRTNSSIFVLTCDDQPQIGDSKKQFILRKKIEDIVKNNIDIKLIPLGKDFNIKTFYNDFINLSKPANGFDEIEKIISEVEVKTPKSRSVSSINFIIDEERDIVFSVSLFNFYTKAKIPAKVKLDKKTNKPVVSTTKTYHNEELLYKSDLAKFCTLAKQNIVFKNEDISILKASIIEPGIRLLGFINRKKNLIYYHFKSCSFIQANEKIKGSILLFNSLLDSCVEMQKIILCYIKVRQGGRVHLAALLPQSEYVDDNGTQIVPAGFHVSYLPFVECLRQIKPNIYDREQKITDREISIGKNICENMPYAYHPTKISNPKINSHWEMLQALALEDEKPKDILDETLPDTNTIDSKLSLIKHDIFKQLSPLGNSPPKANTNKRLAANCDDKNDVVKKFRSNPNEKTMEELVNKNILSSLKVDELKQFLSTLGKDTYGKKADLIDRVSNFYKK